MRFCAPLCLAASRQELRCALLFCTRLTRQACAQAPLLPPARKQVAAPAKAAAPAESTAGTDAAQAVKVPRLKSAFVRVTRAVCCVAQADCCTQGHFSDARRAELKAEKPELSFSEVAKVSRRAMLLVLRGRRAALTLAINAGARLRVERAQRRREGAVARRCRS